MNYLRNFLISLLSVFLLKPGAQSAAKMVLPIGHNQEVNSANYRPDVKRIVSAYVDKSAKFFDAQTVTIGTQVWMTENLDVAEFRNGDPIPEAKSNDEWFRAGREGKPAWCYYNNNSENGFKYGKLYNWYAVNDTRGLAPDGWRIPTDKDWVILAKYLRGYSWAGMKSEPVYETKISYQEQGGFYETKWIPCNNCSYWTERQKVNNPCTMCKNQRGKIVKTGKYIPKTTKKIVEQVRVGGWNGTNKFGFSALPGGYREEEKWVNWGSDAFKGLNSSVYFWLNSDYATKEARAVGFEEGKDNCVYNNGNKVRGFYVRCVKYVSGF